MREATIDNELKWLADQAPTWAWNWASTFEGGAEHAYVIKGRHLDAETYERAARLTHGAGEPRKFYRRLNIELHLPELGVPFGSEPLGQRAMQHGVKLWLMSHRTSVSKALNFAPVTAEYGRQDAPNTASAARSPWDLRALDLDDAFERSGSAAFGGRLRDVVLRGDSPAPVTHLGERAGAALDLGLGSRASGYTPVEASRGLTNSLLIKHARVRDLHVEGSEAFLAQHATRSFDTVLALFGAASYLRPERIRDLHARSRRLVLMHHRGQPATDFFGPTYLPDSPAASRDAARELPGPRVERLGAYQLTVAGA